MPLPLPDLDDRRWSDLVDEATALIHRYAPGWTDYNVSDPGITLIDLLAWITEADVFGLDRIPKSHRERFLALAGSVRHPAKPATTPLEFTVTDASSITVPKGVMLAATTDGTTTFGHQLSQSVQVLGCALSAVQVWSGTAFIDRTRDWRTLTRFDALGTEPSTGTALLLGFDPDPVLNLAARLSMWVDLDEQGATPDDASPPQHHGARTVWEFHDGTQWRGFEGSVVDDTRSLTRPGRVVLPFGEVGAARSVQGAVSQPLRWVRTRLAHGRPDVAPRIGDILVDAGTVVQSAPAFDRWAYADPGYLPPPNFEPGARVSFGVRTDAKGRITEFDGPTGVDDVHALVLDRQGASITLTLLRGGVCDGAPSFETVVAGAPFAGDPQVWTSDLSVNTGWTVVDTLLRSGSSDHHVVFDVATGALRFGDGERGRIPSAGSTVIVSAVRTEGVAANPTARTVWRLDTAHPVTAALTANSPISATSLNIRAGHTTPATAADDLESEQGRAADAVWTHERLVELVPAGDDATLDQLDRGAVLARSRPPRAVTTLDFERLALQVPATAVVRAKAWAGVDPAWPCLVSPGTVTVVVVPGLPALRPTPTPGLLREVHRYLNRRRTLGTRLVVTAPDYVEVSVRAVLAAQPRVDTDRVCADAESALYAFLHPLTGGPHNRGWPFGRNVFQNEVLRRLDLIDGVDHVEEIELTADGVGGGCGDVCVGAFSLVVSGTHEVSIR